MRIIHYLQLRRFALVLFSGLMSIAVDAAELTQSSSTTEPIAPSESDQNALDAPLTMDPEAGESKGTSSPIQSAPPTIIEKPDIAIVTPEEPTPVQTVPAVTSSRVEIEAPRVRVTFASEPPGLTFHLLSGTTSGVGHGIGMYSRGHMGSVSFSMVSRSYERICTAPCVAHLPEGTYRLALSRFDEVPLEGDTPLTLSSLNEDIPDITLHGNYLSRRTGRIVGLMVTLVGAGLMVASVPGAGADNRAAFYVPMGLGLGFTLGGWVTILASRDRAIFTTTSP